MIITKISGGLGNQMFQYAFGRQISKLNNSELKLDLRFFDNPDEVREFQLDIFNIEYTQINSDDAKSLEAQGREYEVGGLNLISKIRGLVNPGSYKIIRQKSRKFNPEYLKLNGNLILDGYWVSEKFFTNIREEIQEIYQVKTHISDANKRTLEKIQNSESVCVHIRRGDYVLDERTNKHHGTCSQDYYRKGAKFYKEKLNNPIFFIFSDDIDWCKKNIDLGTEMVFIKNNSIENGYEDLRLMYNCKHFIIANSTFSWWGAWLSRYNEKNVIAPKHWFAKEGLYDKDIVPEDWLRI